MNDNPAGFGPGEPDENVEKLEVVMKWLGSLRPPPALAPTGPELMAAYMTLKQVVDALKN